MYQSLAQGHRLFSLTNYSVMKALPVVSQSLLEYLQRWASYCFLKKPRPSADNSSFRKFSVTLHLNDCIREAQLSVLTLASGNAWNKVWSLFSILKKIQPLYFARSSPGEAAPLSFHFKYYRLNNL